MSERNSRHSVDYDLLFTDACNFGDYISIKEVKHECLHPVWLAFQDSIESIRVMSLLPQAVVSAAVEYLLPLTQAVYNVLGKPVMDDADLMPNQTAIAAQYSQVSRGFFENRREVQQIFGHNLVIYNKHNLVNSPLTRAGFYALLQSQIVGVWGAFDALTTDLCVAVVNQKPELLDKLGNQEITLSELLKASSNHNWHGRMGELVKVFVRFDSFKGTKEAYKKMFNKDVSKTLESESATVACLLRSQIVHDAGIVTENFLRQANEKRLEPWQSVPLGGLLPLDGRNAAAISEGVVQCANNVIRAMDNWIHLPPSGLLLKIWSRWYEGLEPDLGKETFDDDTRTEAT